MNEVKVAVLYNLPSRESDRSDREMIAELEVLEIARAVRKVLEDLGHEAVNLRCSLEGMETLRSYDAVFNLAEGFEDDLGAEPYVAAMLELLGLPYTGSPPDVLELCRNKFLSKMVLEREGIPTPKFQLFNGVDEEFGLNFPVIAKPAFEDASIGIGFDSVANDRFELDRNVRKILETYHQPALVEEYIEGKEINASLLGNGEDRMILPLSEIVFDFPEGVPRILGFEAKWTEDSPYYRTSLPKCPAELAPGVGEQIKKFALKACSVLGVRDYARVDFRVSEEGIFLLEVNPNPCINPNTSGFLHSANAAGLSYFETVGNIFNSALEREVNLERARIEDKRDLFTYGDLTFRRVKVGDAALLTRWFCDAETDKYMDPSPPDIDETSIVAKILASLDEDFMVYLNDAAIGFASLYEIKKCTADVSFLVGEKGFRGRGFGKKILTGLMDYGFNELGLSSLFASATVGNLPSIRALERAGFKRIGVRRAYQRFEDRCLDEVLFDITKKDFYMPEAKKTGKKEE